MLVETTRALIRLLRERINENVILSAGSILEISKLPVVVLSGPDLKEKKKLAHDGERLRAIDLENLEAVYEVPPRWYDLKFNVNVSCESNLELLSMIEEFSRLNQSNRLIQAVNEERARNYTWDWRVMAGSDVSPNISQVYQGKGTITVYDVEIYSNIREYWPLIRKISTEINQDLIEVSDNDQEESQN